MPRTDDDFNKWDRRGKPKPPPIEKTPDPVRAFVERVDRLTERYKDDPYSQDFWLMPVDVLQAVRDELTKNDPGTQLDLFE